MGAEVYLASTGPEGMERFSDLLSDPKSFYLKLDASLVLLCIAASGTGMLLAGLGLLTCGQLCIGKAHRIVNTPASLV